MKVAEAICRFIGKWISYLPPPILTSMTVTCTIHECCNGEDDDDGLSRLAVAQGEEIMRYQRGLPKGSTMFFFIPPITAVSCS